MFKRNCFVIFFLVTSYVVFGESPIIESPIIESPILIPPPADPPIMVDYLQRFIRADFSGKVGILNEAASNTDVDSTLLFEHALQFVLDNYAQIDDLRDMNTITSYSVNGLLQGFNPERINDSNVINILWKFVSDYPDSNIKADIIIALSVLGKENRELITNLNNYLMEINRLFNLGEIVDYSIVSACISALMELGDSSSYPVLFSIICSGYPEVISSEAYGALEIIPGNLQQFLLNVIENNPPDEKLMAFRAVLNSEKMTVAERGQIAELALAQSLLHSDEAVDLSLIRYDAILKLTQLRWTRANALAIRHYYIVLADYQHDIVPKERFLEAIMCLGALGNSDAALVLGLQLGLINIRTQTTGVFDAEITLAIVQALGLIGDNAAFNHLSYVINLPYTEEIIAAAREAIDRLKW
jgi:hypothetical protein